jgi:F0F1-type ATP synthase assembly protein I
MVDSSPKPSGGPGLSEAERSRKNMFFALRIVGDFGATIAVPVVLLALLGKWLDAKYGTAPSLLIAGFVLAATLSAVSIARKAKRYAKTYDELNRR